MVIPCVHLILKDLEAVLKEIYAGLETRDMVVVVGEY